MYLEGLYDLETIAIFVQKPRVPSVCQATKSGILWEQFACLHGLRHMIDN